MGYRLAVGSSGPPDNVELVLRSLQRADVFQGVVNGADVQNGKPDPEVFDTVLKVASQGIDRSDKDMILSLLSVQFEAGEDSAGHIELTLAGDGGVRLAVEALDVTLKDVTRPYLAPSRHTPGHPD